MARTFAAPVALLLVLSAPLVPVAAQDDSVERSFHGNAVHLDLSAGRYQVIPSRDSRIRVTPRTKTDQVSTRITLNLLETRATVRVVGPKDGFEADIELPARASVSVRSVPAFRWTGEATQELLVR